MKSMVKKPAKRASGGPEIRVHLKWEHKGPVLLMADDADTEMQCGDGYETRYNKSRYVFKKENAITKNNIS